MSDKLKLGNWHDSIGTKYENSPNREAPNKHLKGSKKYKDMIDRGSKAADQKNLPFTFSKPAKRTKAPENIYHLCFLCGHVSMVSRHRVSQTCSGCNQQTQVNKYNTYLAQEEVELALERWHVAHKRDE